VAAATGKFFGQAMTAGDIYTIAGNGQFGYSCDGATGADAVISYPAGLAFDHAGNLLIADTGNWTLRVVAVRSGTFYGQPMTGGHIYTLAGNGSRGTRGNGGPASAARLEAPEGVTVDPAGNLVVAEDQSIFVIAQASGTFYGQVMTSAWRCRPPVRSTWRHRPGSAGSAASSRLSRFSFRGRSGY
jgi:secreted PhoX family phosphatase